jgi:hypothetical protein
MGGMRWTKGVIGRGETKTFGEDMSMILCGELVVNVARTVKAESSVKTTVPNAAQHCARSK